MGMVQSPSPSLNTPQAALGAGSPGGEEAAYREKVRQLSKYIEPLRRMVHRMVSEGESEWTDPIIFLTTNQTFCFKAIVVLNTTFEVVWLHSYWCLQTLSRHRVGNHECCYTINITIKLI